MNRAWALHSAAHALDVQIKAIDDDKSDEIRTKNGALRAAVQRHYDVLKRERERISDERKSLPMGPLPTLYAWRSLRRDLESMIRKHAEALKRFERRLGSQSLADAMAYNAEEALTAEAQAERAGKCLSIARQVLVERDMAHACVCLLDQVCKEYDRAQEFVLDRATSSQGGSNTRRAVEQAQIKGAALFARETAYLIAMGQEYIDGMRVYEFAHSRSATAETVQAAIDDGARRLRAIMTDESKRNDDHTLKTEPQYEADLLEVRLERLSVQLEELCGGPNDEQPSAEQLRE